MLMGLAFLSIGEDTATFYLRAPLKRLWTRGQCLNLVFFSPSSSLQPSFSWFTEHQQRQSCE